MRFNYRKSNDTLSEIPNALKLIFGILYLGLYGFKSLSKYIVILEN